MRKLTQCFAFKAFYALTLVLLVLAIGTFAFVGAGVSDEIVASAALGSNSTTKLLDGTGMQYGANALRATTDDFYSEGTGSVAYRSDGIAISGSSSLITKPGLVTGSTADYANMNANASVFYALQDPNTSVRFRYDFKISGTVTSVFDINMEIYYSNAVGESNKVGESVLQTITTNVSDSYSVEPSLEILVPGRQAATGNAHVFVKVSFNSGSDTLVISKSVITVTAESDEIDIDNLTGIDLLITGKNRNPVVIKNVKSQNGMEQLASVYVKEGDVITLNASANVRDASGEQKKHTFGTLYAAAFGRIGSSCIDWYSYYDSNYGSNRSYLTRVEDEQNIVYPDGSDADIERKISIYNGFSASFVVTTGVSNAKTISIIPRIIRSYNGSNYEYWTPDSIDVVPEKEIVINVDNKAPTAPKLDVTQGLGLTIEKRQWFTQSNNFYLRYDEKTLNTNTDVSNESVYAFIVDKNLLSVPQNYDFTPGNAEPFNYVVNGVSLTTRRQELGKFTNGEEVLRSQLSFDTYGEYGLVLYAIDGAGNVSSPTLYTAQQDKVVKIDSRNMGVGIFINHGTEYTDVNLLQPAPSNKQQFQRFCSVYVFTGANYHDENGKCIQPVDDTPSNALATSDLISAKRGMDVTIRVVMDSTQAYNYSYVRLGSTYLSYDNPEFVYDKFGNRVYDYTYKLNDDIWTENESSTNRALTAYFHRRVDLRLVEDDFTFSYTWSANRIEFSRNVQAYFKNPINADDKVTMQPTIAVEYFRPVTISIESEYVKEGSNVILQGKGRLVINGVTFEVDGDYDLNAFARGEITFISGASEYQVMDVFTSGFTTIDGTSYATYELGTYDLYSGRGDGFMDAGDYYYRAYVVPNSNTFYYGELVSKFTIKKADPGVIDAFAKNQLTYGESMDKLKFASYDRTGVEIAETNNTIVVNGVEYVKVDSGVYGRFVIRVPQIGSIDYELHPVATDYAITVEFQPMNLLQLTNAQIKENFSVLSAYFDEVKGSDGSVLGYEMKEGMQTARNYNVQTLQIPITISHKMATVLARFESLETYYDGFDKSVDLYVYTIDALGNAQELSDIPVIVEYKVFGEGDGSYTTVKPVNAGQYSVRMKIDDRLSNYESDYTVDTLYIYTRELEISVDESVQEHSVLDEEVIVAGNAVDEMLTYTYSHTATASYFAGYYNGAEFTRVPGILYRYAFYKYAYYDHDMNVVEIENPEWTEYVDIIGGSALDAGLYLMEVAINNQNNSGSKYIIVNVEQVRRGDKASLNISTPSAQSNYQTVNLDGSSNGRTGHLEFGQTLQSMQSTILGKGGSAKFTPRGTTTATSIASRFIFETEDNYVTRTLPSLGYTELATNGYGEKVLPVKFDEGGRVSPYSIMVIWQAGTTDEYGNFIPNYNFRAEAFELTIYVVRATADFSAYNLSDLTYGQKVEEASFEGKITSHGYEFQEGDFTITIPDETKKYVPQGGENQILCSFTPSDALIRKFLPLNNVEINLNVAKRNLEIGFNLVDVKGDDFDGNLYQNAVVHTYGVAYQNPAFTLTPVGISGLSTSGVVPQFTFLKDYVSGQELQDGEELIEYEGVTYIKLSGITTSTPVGKYYVLAEIIESDNNFVGIAFNTYFVIRAELFYEGGSLPQKSIEYSENLNSVDFGTVLVVNSANGNYNKFFRGSFKLAVKDDMGNLIFDFLPEVTLDNSSYNTVIVFEPAGEQSVVDDYNNNFRPYVKDYFLRVDKRNVTDTIVVDGLNQVFNGLKKEITVSIPDPVDNGKELPFAVNYLTDRTYAGEHQVEIVIDSSVENYTGYLIVTLVIEKAPLTITDELVERAYDATQFVYEPKYEVSLEAYKNAIYNFEISYRDYLGNALDRAPIAIGMYYADVTLVDDNFEEVKTVIMHVTPSHEGYVGLSQTYLPATSDEKIIPVAPNYNKIMVAGELRDHPTVNYRVEYKEQGVSDEYYHTDVPYNAGTYDVRLVFSERGYYSVRTLQMEIMKREAVFVLDERYERDYIGTKVNFAVLLPEGVTVAEYYYKESGSEQDFVLGAVPVYAGLYEVKIVLIDENYTGEASTLLEVRKANLTINENPIIANTVEFNTPSEEVTFLAGSGVVIFAHTAENVTEKGEWRVKTDVSAFRTGVHNVEIEFVPEDSDNFNVAVTTMNLSIVQRNVSEFIRVEGAVYDEANDNYVITTEYVNDKITVKAYLTDEANVVDGYTDVSFNIKYNNVNSAPITVGKYVVSVTVSDANYSGNVSNVILNVVHATPVIVLPKVNDIRKGDTLSDSYVAENSGGAYIASNNKNVPGRFTILAPYKVVMDKANEQEIELLFTPVDRDNVAEVVVKAYVNVIGEDVVITDSDIIVTSKSGGAVYYGATLDSYTIALTDEKASYGRVEWVDSSKILHVGEKAEYLFIPNDTDLYNKKVLTTDKAVISKATFMLGEGGSVILYEGKALRDAIVSLNLYNSEYPEMKVEGCSVSLISDSLDYVATSSDIGKFLAGVTLKVVVTHPDYDDNTNNQFEFDVYVMRLIEDFKLQSTSKYYDGEAVTIEDLGVTLVGTDYLPGADEVVFKSILLNGVAVSEIKEAGVYAVTLKIDEKTYEEGGNTLFGAHVGEYTFTYEVLKRDLSDVMSVSGNEVTYAESANLTVSFEGYEVNASDVKFNYYSENMSTDYGALPPTDAGNYKVVVSIKGSNPYYTANKEFDYIINKRLATVTLDASYVYTYSATTQVNVVPEISNNVTSEYVQIMYYPMGQTTGTTEKPVNVGTYRVVVTVVNHPNVYGRGESIVNIRQASVTISQTPTVDNVIYGVMLKHAGISGGQAEATNGAVIEGAFSFVEPEKNDLPAGNNTVTLMFTPKNSNYAQATCLVNIYVAKATVGIEFASLSKVYTGQPLHPDVATTLNVSFAYRQGSLNVENAVNAGSYTVIVTINDDNYQGQREATFTIVKASVIEEESTLPVLSENGQAVTNVEVVYGQALNTASILGYQMVYVNGGRAVYGTFKFVHEDTVLGDAGLYEGVEYTFIPEDGDNYEVYYGVLNVKVVKARATIQVSANNFVYGDVITSPVFTTTPANLNVDNLEFEREALGQILKTGTTLFTAYVNDNNYEGSIQYAIVVTKKAIRISYLRDGNAIDVYQTTYGNLYYARAMIVTDTLVDGEDRANYEYYESKILYRYTSVGSGETTVVPPTKVGEYVVSAHLEDNNYIIDSNYATISYKVDKARVSELKFEQNSLSNQVYGQVSMPIVVTTPANVRCEIEFPGYTSMPTNAGTYPIKVTVTDENYVQDTRTAMFNINKKPITIENLKAQNKAYDGISLITVTGEPKGIMNNDEVEVILFAHTRDNKVNVGVHSVVISGWELRGLHADNYELRDPLYNLTATISNKVITDPNSTSYITSPDGFSSNVTVSFSEVYDTVDQTNWFTKMLGQKATVQVIEVKENGLNTVLNSKVKFYVRIPEEYKDAKNLTIEGIGNLEGVIISREGDYATFYADSSGEIVFYKNDFPYWIVPVAAVILMIILGGVFALIALPIRRRKHIPHDARKAYEWNAGLEGREHVYRKKVEQQIVEKKRRWRY